MKKPTLKTLRKMYDESEGKFSEIPQCCVNSYVKGWTLDKLRVHLQRAQLRELLQSNRNYVPCFNCLRSGRVQRNIRSGVSKRGKQLHALIRRQLARKILP